MAIWIDWGTKTINVPKNDLTLVQTTPLEIREMDLNWFRMQLKDLEDTPDGMAFPDTHRHNTEVSMGGITFARVIEVLDPYTITFEDGQYAVNLVGANSNVGDRINVNQVSVRSQNSAGLISTPLIEYGAFNNGIWYNEEAGNEGTLFPIGTKLKPAKRLTDVKEIANYRGFNVIYVMGNATVDNTIDFTRFIFEGQTHVNNLINISEQSQVQNAVFRDLTVTGWLDGGNEVINSVVKDLRYVNGHVHDCDLEGLIELAGGANAIFANCIAQNPKNPPMFDMGGTGQNLIMPNFSGIMYITNLRGANYANVGLSGGEIILNSSTVTNGLIYVSGIGELSDENGIRIPTGTWNESVTIVNNLVSRENITSSVWDQNLSEHIIVGTPGETMAERKFNNEILIDVINGVSGTTFPIGTVGLPVNNLADAKLISNRTKLNVFKINGSVTLNGGDYNNFIFKGNDFQHDIVIIEDNPLQNVSFEGLTITGILDNLGDDESKIQFRNCFLMNVSDMYGELIGCRISGVITVGAGKYFSGIEVVSEGDLTVIDLQNTPCTVSLDINSGLVTFINTVEGCLIELNLKGGEVILSPSCAGGEFYAEGYGTLYNQSTMTIKDNHLLALETIPEYVWNKELP